MTKTTKTKAADPIKPEDISKGTSKVAATAREFVKRSAATAKERAEDIHEGTEKFNSGLENTMHRVVGGYASILGGIANATYANVDHYLTTVEKLAGAKSVSEAMKIQGDYLRDSTAANIERSRNAANTVREVVVDNTSALREQVAKVWPYGQKAA